MIVNIAKANGLLLSDEGKMREVDRAEAFLREGPVEREV